MIVAISSIYYLFNYVPSICLICLSTIYLFIIYPSIYYHLLSVYHVSIYYHVCLSSVYYVSIYLLSSACNLSVCAYIYSSFFLKHANPTLPSPRVSSFSPILSSSNPWICCYGCCVGFVLYFDPVSHSANQSSLDLAVAQAGVDLLTVSCLHYPSARTPCQAPSLPSHTSPWLLPTCSCCLWRLSSILLLFVIQKQAQMWTSSHVPTN